ncbi:MULTISPECIES: hypothetical protein [Pseudomonas]|jgi:hypothetical protein|uniref:hypothetical protein n=1 Tax=Pseudomonas TaxID=286 RepID=UPI00126A42D3|nr:MULTISPECIES: hypothetical protein [Pseudomonas]WAB89685.1 hypothetical protein OSS47_16055 [Pseudomonas citronellolis]
MSRVEKYHSPYFVQKVPVSSEMVGRPRFDVLSEFCAGRKVLHVGCSDFPITNVQENLHIKLDAVCSHLDGFDINTEAFEDLRPHVKGQLFEAWPQVTEKYDVVLVPEVLEHVNNVADFLGDLDRIDTDKYILTVPDAYSCFKYHFDYEDGTFFEGVHPDHNCWYSPYTFTNVVKKYTPWNIEWLGFYNNISLLMVASKR